MGILRAEELAVGHVGEFGRHGDADGHAVHLIRLLVLVGPPYAGADILAGGGDPRVSQGILPEGHAAEAPRLHRVTGIVEVDAVGLTLRQGCREVHEHRVEVPRIGELLTPEEDAVDVHVVEQIDLDAVAVFEHGKVDGVRAAHPSTFRVHLDVETVGQQIVVCAERTVGAPQGIPSAECQASFHRVHQRPVVLQQDVGRGVNQVEFPGLIILRVDRDAFPPIVPRQRHVSAEVRSMNGPFAGREHQGPFNGDAGSGIQEREGHLRPATAGDRHQTQEDCDDLLVSHHCSVTTKIVCGSPRGVTESSANLPSVAV
jgi:hypothetical protein